MEVETSSCSGAGSDVACDVARRLTVLPRLLKYDFTWFTNSPDYDSCICEALHSHDYLCPFNSFCYQIPTVLYIIPALY